MKVEFDKIGQGCSICANKPTYCAMCERNPNLLQLKDFFKKPPKPSGPLPKGKVGDDTLKISKANAEELAAWGIHVPIGDHFQPAPSGEQEPKGQDEQ